MVAIPSFSGGGVSLSAANIWTALQTLSAGAAANTLALGGATIGTNALAVTGASLFGGAVLMSSSLNVTGSIQASADLIVAGGGAIYWGANQTIIRAGTVNGNLKLSTYSGTDFGLLQLGGTGPDHPAIKRSTTKLHARLADDSAFAELVFLLPTANPGPGTLWNNGGTLTIGT